MTIFRIVTSLVRAIQMTGAPRVTPLVERVFPHDPRAFTQGLAYRDGMLYESTGLRNASSLRRIDPSNGAILEELPVEGVFAEGIAFLEERIYQLTWKDRRYLVYDILPLRLVGGGSIDHDGWGIAGEGQWLYVTDGSSLIRRYDGVMRVRDTAQARLAGIRLCHLNDIEVARNRLYANVWRTPFIAEVRLPAGDVTRIIDCGNLCNRERSGDRNSIMNGIAYNPDNGTFFVTGKRWRQYYEISLPD